jgi:hypothetical protein
LSSGEEISPGVRLYFDQAAEATLTVDSKTDHSLSPPDYLNTLGLNFTESSGWAWLEVDLQWGELSTAERFQLSLYAQPSRSVEVQARLRLPRQGGEPQDYPFANIELGVDDRNAVESGDISIPDLIEFDTREKPQFLLFLDISSDLSILINYLNVYFA